MTLILTDKDTCPRCGNKFECSKSGKCWCYEMDVPASILDSINEKYDSCLCPDCLSRLSKSAF